MFASRAWLVLAALLLAAAAGPAAPRAGEAAGEAAAPAEKLVLKTYDVRELTLQVPDFPGPEIGLGPLTSWRGEMPVFTAPPPAPLLTSFIIRDMIVQRVRPESWQPGKGSSIEERDGRLVVVQTEGVHRQINTLLQELRADIVRPVSVQALVVLADERTAARMRDRKSLEFTAEEAEELVKAAGKGGLLAASQVLCANGQRKHAAALRKRAFVAGYVGGGDWALAPIQGVGLIGTVFDVRPTLSSDRSTADVELRLTLAGDWHETPAEFSTVVVPGLARKPAKPAEPQAEAPAGTAPAGAEAAKPAPSETDDGVVLPFRGKFSLPSLRCWRLRNCLTVPMDKYVLAGTFRAPPFEGGGKGDTAPRTALVLIGVRPACWPERPGGGAPAPEPADRNVQRIYDLRDLVNVIPNFPGPILSLATGSSGRGGAPIMTAYQDLAFFRPGTIEHMIKQSIQPGSWGANGTALQEQNGQIIVWHVPGVQQQVEKLLAEVRAGCKQRISVHGLVVTTDQAGAARLRLRRSVEFTAEETEALVKAAGSKGVLAAAQVVCFNGQRVHLAAERQISYVSGFTSSGPSVIPNVGLGSEGWSLDVRPTLSLDRKAADVELRFSLEDGWREDQASAAAFATEVPPAGDAGGRNKSKTLRNQLAPPRSWSVTERGCPTVPVGKYVLAGTFQKPADGGAPGGSYLMLIKVEVEDPGRK